MAFNIQDFRSNGLIYGGARPTQFEVQLFPPFASETTKRTTLLIHASSLPGFYIQPAVAPYFGASIKFAGDRVYQDWTVEVLNDEDFALRAMLEKWSNGINSLISNRLDPNLWPTGYKSNAEVTQFGKDGRRLRTYRFTGFWPLSIDPIQLSWSAPGQLETFMVTFSLDYFEPIEQDSSPDTYNPILPDDGAVSGNPGIPLI